MDPHRTSRLAKHSYPIRTPAEVIDILLHPLQSSHHITYPIAAIMNTIIEGEETNTTNAVVHRYYNRVSARREVRPVCVGVFA